MTGRTTRSSTSTIRCAARALRRRLPHHNLWQGEHLVPVRQQQPAVLAGVYFIPKLRANIISLDQLDKNESKVVIKNNHLCV